MDAAWLVRARWRLRGAWLRPAFLTLTIADVVIGVLLPAVGDSESAVGVLVLALFLNLIAVIIITVPGSALIRRARPDLPVVVARDRAGTWAVMLVTAGFLALGLGHRPTIQADRAALRDAEVRAVAWMGDHAPAQFRANLTDLDTYTIQAGSIYRTCVPNSAGTRTYCVIVRRHMPFAQSVAPAGYESNWLFAEGAN